MTSVVIDGKDRNGVRVSASLDNFLWQLLCADFKSEAEARAWIRRLMAERVAAGRWSSFARNQCLMRVCKPSLVNRVLGAEAQMDIEEL